MLSRTIPSLVMTLMLWAGGGWAQAAAPRVAVWDPQVGTDQTRFAIDLAMYDRVTEGLRAGGVEVARLTAEQIADPQTFGADGFDAVMFGDEVIPKVTIPAVLKFMDEGGVLVGLGGKLPFCVRIERPEDGGKWRMAPMEPTFAWQTGEVLNHLHLKYIYRPAMHNVARQFTATPLLRCYLPEASDPQGRLRNWWIVPFTSKGDAGEVFPLIRSRRIDGADVTPQMFVARRGGRHAILSLNAFYADGSEREVWPHADATVVALAQLATDLRAGKLQLTPEQAVSIPEDLPPPQPLRSRRPYASVEPEAATPLARFGRFDGSSFDLDDGPLPPRLDPGLRLAYTRTHAGIRAEVGGTRVLDESYVYGDGGGESNFTVDAYRDVPAELQRVVFVPDARGERTLTLSNPGAEPIYLDAVRLERRTGPTPHRWIGQYAGFLTSLPNGVNTIPVEKTRSWSVMRTDLRGQ